MPGAIAILLLGALGAHAVSNYEAPPAPLPPRKTAIFPYSVYKKTLEEKQLLAAAQHEIGELRTSPAPKHDAAAAETVYLYLPAFKNAHKEDIASHEEVPAPDRMTQRRPGSHELQSANSRRDPLPYRTSIFRPHTNHIVTSTEQRFAGIKYRPGALTASSRPPVAVPTNGYSPRIVNGVPLNNDLGVEEPAYKSLAPAPFGFGGSPQPSLSPDNNVVSAILSQSQSNLRHSPPTSFSGFGQPLSPIEALTGGGTAARASPNDALAPLSALLGGGSPLEQITKLARNLLSLPAGNKEIFNAVTKALGSGTAAEGAKLTSSAVAGAKSGTETIFSSVKDAENNTSTPAGNATDLPEDPSKLLAAAIANGELDMVLNKSTSTDSPFKTGGKLVDWIQQNRPKESILKVGERLPYYGRYCGNFAQNDSSHNVDGAAWAVDERHFIVSKFHYKPKTGFENVTFWAGPAKPTSLPVDVIPSDNGIYLEAVPLDLKLFSKADVETVQAKIRDIKSVAKDDINSTQISAAEAEEVSDDTIASNSVKRMRRNVSLPLHFAASKNANNDSVKNAEANDAKPENVSSFRPLDWYAGFQPLLLTLPEHYSIKDLHWLSIYDHKRHESLATVLISNDIAFQVPGSVDLRPLAPIGPYNVSSGKIKLVNTKTIEVENFTLKTNGMPVWFLAGKDILPHKHGRILPVFDKVTMTSSCDSLRDYNNETVTIRLPGDLDMKDVFWFSVFSITKVISMSHIYLPYNDLRLPPDLLPISTPHCVFKD